MTLFIMFGHEAMCSVESVYMCVRIQYQYPYGLMEIHMLHVCVLCVVMVTGCWNAV